MAVTRIQFVNKDSTLTTVSQTTKSVTAVKRVLAPLTATKTVAGIVLPVVGHNIVQNAVVSATPPLNPYEGQVWIDIS